MALNTFILAWYSITIPYYLFGFVLFGTAFMNYIPDPRYGVTWFVIIFVPVTFILPVVIIAAYAIYIIGNKAMRELASYFIIFIIILKAFILLYLLIVGYSCSLGNGLCSYVPTDGVPDDPTDSTTFQVLWIWLLVEYIIVLLMWMLWAFIPFYAQSAQKGLVKDKLQKRLGNEVDVETLAECLINDGDLGSGNVNNNNNNIEGEDYMPPVSSNQRGGNRENAPLLSGFGSMFGRKKTVHVSKKE